MILGLDFGATRVKSRLLQSSKDHKISFDTKGSLFFSTKSGFVNKNFFVNTFKKHLNFYLKKSLKVNKIIICSEMHGFFYSNGNYISNYFSWRCANKISFDKVLNKKNFISMTGMTPREGTPYFRIKNIKNIEDVFGISEFICKHFGEFNNVLHSTYAQSLGIYLISNKNLSINKELSSVNKNIKVNYDYLNKVGKINYKKNIISIYGGIGDLQCSNKLISMSDDQLLMNISTGSQLIFKFDPKVKNFDYRISFRRKFYSCITHIPSGRYLIYLAQKMKISKKNFFNELGSINISKLQLNEYSDYNLEDLNKNFEKIYRKCTKKKFLEIIIFVYANQYLKLLKKIKFTKLIITGGLSLHLNNLIEYLKYSLPIKNIELSDYEDETIKFMLDNYSKLC